MEKNHKKYKALKIANEEANAFVKECIQTALINLIREKQYDEISITDIVKEAGVSRSSYYRNFNSKDCILDFLLERIATSIENTLDYNNATADGEPICWRDWWVIVLNVIKQHHDTYSLLLEAKFDIKIQQVFQRRMLAHSKITEEIGIHKSFYYSGALCSVVANWIRSDYNISVEELANYCASF